MEPLTNVRLSEEGLAIVKRILLSSPGCDFEPEILREKEIDLYCLHSTVPTGGAVTLFAYAKKEGKEVLHAEDVILAFSSLRHAEDTWNWLNADPAFLSDMKAQGFQLDGQECKNRFFFSHLLNPVYISKLAGDKVEVEYQNGGLVISVQAVFSGHLPIRVGQQVALHSGCIICQLDKNLAGQILASQRQSDEIWPCYKNLSESSIDLERDFGASLFQFNLSNFQKYPL